MCGEEKPLVMFPKSMTDGKVYYKWNCSKCISKLTVQRRTPGQKERKRERERVAVKTNAKAIARAKRSSAAAWRRKVAARISENIGAYSVIHWHKCEKCTKERMFRHQERHDPLCAWCRRFENEKGKPKPPISLKEVQCPCCQKKFFGKTIKSKCADCLKEKRKESIRLTRKSRRKRLNDKTFSARCRKYGVKYEPVNRIKVYEKDKYKCYLCKRKVVISDEYRPDQATLDHIVPLSLGGSHTYDNVRTCCMLCNGKRSNNVSKPVQMGIWCQAKGDNKGEGASIPNRL